MTNKPTSILDLADELGEHVCAYPPKPIERPKLIETQVARLNPNLWPQLKEGGGL